MQTNPRLFQMKQLGGPLQIFSENYRPGSKLRKEKNSTVYCFTLWILARVKKTFSYSEIVKDCFLASAEILFTDFDNKDAILKQIKGLQLSVNNNEVDEKHRKGHMM